MTWAWHRAQHSKGCANMRDICQGTTGAVSNTPQTTKGLFGTCPGMAPHGGIYSGGPGWPPAQGSLSCCPTVLPSPDTAPAALCPLLWAFLHPHSLHNTLSYILHPLITPTSFHPIPEHPRTSQLCPHLGTPHHSTPSSCIPPSVLHPIHSLWVLCGLRGHTGTSGTLPVPAPGSAPAFGCRVKQPAGLGPAPGNSTAAESPAERAEQCWEYQSGRLGAAHTARAFIPQDPQLGQPGAQPCSASLCAGASTVRRDWGKPGRRERSGERVERSRHL